MRRETDGPLCRFETFFHFIEKSVDRNTDSVQRWRYNKQYLRGYTSFMFVPNGWYHIQFCLTSESLENLALRWLNKI